MSPERKLARVLVCLNHVARIIHRKRESQRDVSGCRTLRNKGSRGNDERVGNENRAVRSLFLPLSMKRPANVASAVKGRSGYKRDSSFRQSISVR